MDGVRRALAVGAAALLSAVAAAAGLPGEVRAAGAALDAARPEPGAFCTRSGCAPAAAPSWSAPLGFAAAALACVGLGRRRSRAPCAGAWARASIRS